MGVMAVQWRTPALLQLLVVAVVSFALGYLTQRYNLEMLSHTAQVPTPSLALAKPTAALMSNIDCTTYFRHFFRPPSDVLGLPPTTLLDAESVRRRFLALFEAQRQGPEAQDELQTLCSAFLLLMSRVSPPQTQVTNNIAVRSAHINLHLDERFGALRQHTAELQVRLGQAQQENAQLQPLSERALVSAGPCAV